MSPSLPQRPQVSSAGSRDVAALRLELAEAERILRWRAEREAAVFAIAEREALGEARAACHDFDRVRPGAEMRLRAIRAGGSEDFLGEEQLAEMALRYAERADAAYTLIAFAGRQDKLRYLRGGEEREAVVREALKRGGVYTERNFFQEMVR